MVKFFGVIFLGQPREDEARRGARRRPLGSALGSSGSRLAACCSACCRCSSSSCIDPVTQQLVGAGIGPTRRASGWLLLAPISVDRASYSPLIFLLGHRCAASRSPSLLVRRLYHGRAAPRAAVGLRLPAADGAHAGHGRGLRPADPPDLRAVLPHASAQLPSPFDAQPRYRVTVEDHFWHWLYVPIADAASSVLAALVGRCSRAASRSTCCTASSTLIALLIAGEAMSTLAGIALAAAARSLLALAARAAARRAGSTSAAPGCRTSRRPACCSPTAMLHKLFNKESVVAEHASPLFRAAPYVVFGCMLLAARSCRRWRPTCRSRRPPTRSRWSACSRWRACSSRWPRWTSAPRSARMGARREMLIGFLAEPALLMVLFSASLISQVDLAATIVETLAHRELAIYPSLAFAGVAFTMVSLAENARIPVDNPATHLELTMIHEAMILEYSGRHLALIEWAASLKLFAYSCIGLALFLPWGIAEAQATAARCCWRCRCWSSSSPSAALRSR